MRKIFLKLLAMLILLIVGIYLSIPLLIRTCAHIFLQNSHYDVEMRDIKYNFPFVKIKEIHFIHKENKEKISFLNLEFSPIFKEIYKNKILIDSISLEKVKNDLFVFEKIKGNAIICFSENKISIQK